MSSIGSKAASPERHPVDLAFEYRTEMAAIGKPGERVFQ